MSRVGSIALLAAGVTLVVGTPLTDGFGLDAVAPGCGLWQVMLVALGAAAVLAALPSRRLDAAAPAPRLVEWQVVVLALWLGLVTGVAEVVHTAARRVFGVVVRQPVDQVWMAPSVHALFFIVVALAALVFASNRRRVPLEGAVFCGAAVAAWSQLFTYPALHDAAVLLLSAGVGVTVARAAVRRPGAFLRLCYRSTPWLAALVVVAAGAIFALRGAAEAGVVSRLDAPPRGARNVLLIVLDTVRADHMGFHGYERDTTPHLDKLAASSAVFDYAITTAPWTLPTHASFFTGRYPFETMTSHTRPLDDTYPTVAEFLSSQGYMTGGFVGNIHYCSSVWGIARGFAHYEDYHLTPGTLMLSAGTGRGLNYMLRGNRFRESERNDAKTVTDGFLRWLDGVDGRPFFAFLNYFDAHALYLPPGRWATKFGPRTSGIDEWYVGASSERTDEEVQGFIDAYDGAIAYIDHHIGLLLEELSERGLRDDTIVIVTSDHGEQFGEHGLWDHANSVYRQLLHAPLVISSPGDRTGARVTDIVTVNELPATIVDLAGITARHPFPGHSLVPLWRDSGSGEAVEVSPAWSTGAGIGVGDVSLFADGLHYLNRASVVEEVYDVVADPMELNNLIETDVGQQFATRARAAGARILSLRGVMQPGGSSSSGAK